MEYRIAKAWRITATVIFMALIAFGTALLLASHYSTTMKSPPVAVIMGLLTIALAVIAWLNTIKTRLIIDDNAITQQDAFSKRWFLHSEIKGCRSDGRYLYLLPINGARTMRISSYMGSFKEIKEWAKQKYMDVDQLNIETETTEILANEQFGFSEEDRKAMLGKAKTVTRVINVIAVLLAIWLWVKPVPYALVWCLVLALPFIALYILWRFKGLVTVNDASKSAYPSMQLVLFSACLIVTARAIKDYELYEYNRIWIYMIIITGILLGAAYVIAYTGPPRAINKKPVIWALLVLFAVYSYGASVFINCNFDASTTQVFTLPVTGMHINTGKTTTYYITTPPWGRYEEGQDISVSGSMYRATHIGDSIHIYLKDGYIGIPWFFSKKY